MYSNYFNPQYTNPYQYTQTPYLQNQLQQLQQLQQSQPQQITQPVDNQMTQPINSPNTLNGKIVSSIDEVKASQVDLMGNIQYYPSSNGKSIYSKQMLLDGSSCVKEYALLEDIKPTINMEDRVSKLEEELSKLTKELGGGIAND